MSGYTYDTGVLIAAERNDRSVWAVHRVMLEQGFSPSVPTTVVAQAWRGGPQALLSRLLSGCELQTFTEVDARECGSLLARNGSTDVVDASAVVLARRRNEVLLTSDPEDLGRLASTLGGPKVEIRSINYLGS